MAIAAEPLSEADTLVLAGRIGWAWKELRRGAAMGILRDHLFGQGEDALEPGQFDTLDLLVRQEAWRMSDLADALRVDPSTATRAVQRLIKEGLAERRSSVDDGRVVMVTASPAGRLRHAAIEERRKDVMITMVSEFAPDERRRLADLMERLVAALDHYAADLQPGAEADR
jgi:DNA-binding MarR family transcriptional regulator